MNIASHPCVTSPGTTRPSDAISDAAWNAVAVASIHWQQSVNALATILASAKSHGLTVAEMAEAGGLDEDHVAWLIESAA